ncbi:hypothetical protein ACVNP0_03395 [Staphylococcus aureus]
MKTRKEEEVKDASTVLVNAVKLNAKNNCSIYHIIN